MACDVGYLEMTFDFIIGQTIDFHQLPYLFWCSHCNNIYKKNSPYSYGLISEYIKSIRFKHEDFILIELIWLRFLLSKGINMFIFNIFHQSEIESKSESKIQISNK